MTLYVRLLGLPKLSIDEVELHLRGHKPWALFAYLVTTRKAYSRQHLVDLLFDESADPRGSLRWTLSQIRKNLGNKYLLADRRQVAFNFDSDYWCDLEALQAGKTDAHFEEFLQGLEVRDGRRFMDWLFFEREHWRDVCQQVLVSKLEQHERTGDDEAVLVAVKDLIQCDNLREAWHRAGMRAYARQGKREAAMGQYDLCRQILEKELGTPPSDRTQTLAAAIQSGDYPDGVESTHQQIRHPDKPAAFPAPELISQTNLPAQTSSFVGREAEIQLICERLADPNCRLLTVLGPGGTGKSRLSVQAAAKLYNNSEHGVYLVPLASINSLDSFLPLLARNVGLPISGDKSLSTQILNYLRDRRVLLLLDNFEHLLSDSGWQTIAEFLNNLLLTASGVKILVTSRQRLLLPDEWLLDLQGLDYPPQADLPRSEILSFAAVQLFVQRKAQLHASYKPATVSSAELASVIGICRLVQGMPLAIELAAFWARQLECQEIEQAIAADLGFLASPSSTGPDRHASLRATFEHSWRLLRRDERVLLHQLAVFRGSFDRKAAAAVTGATLFSLSHLVDTSLLQGLPQHRYQMHELIRQFALEKLAENGDQETATLDRHCDFYCGYLAEREYDLKSERQIEAAGEIEADIGNAATAWAWAAKRGHWKLLAEAAFSLGHFLRQRARLQEGRTLFSEAAVRLKSGIGDEAATLALIRITYWQSQFTEPAQVKTRLDACGAYLDDGSLNSEETGADRASLAWAMGRYHIEVQGDREAAKRYYEQSLQIAEQIRATWEQARALGSMAEVSFWKEGDYLGAQQMAGKSLILREKIGDVAGLVECLNLLTLTSAYLHQYQEALAYGQNGLNLSHQLGILQTKQTRWVLSFVYLMLGDIDKTVACLHQCLQECKTLGDREGLLPIYKGLAYRNMLGGYYEQAKKYAALTLAQPAETVEQEMYRRSAHYSLSHIAFHEGDYVAARNHAQMATEFLDQYGSHNLRGHAIMSLCAAHMALEQYPEAVHYARVLLDYSIGFGGVAGLLALNLVALLLGRHARAESEKERVFELIGMQRHHFPMTDTPAYHEWTERLLPPHLAALGLERIKTALARGATLDPDTMVPPLLGELEVLCDALCKHDEYKEPEWVSS